jgi:uncharacterized protein (TIGR02996 family)
MPRKAASSPEDAFLQTILDHPDDDIPRLVFADWLEEHGNPRGAFIRLQCERAKLTQYDPAWKTVLAQEAALLKQFEAEWSKPVLRYVDEAHYRRGFIEHVRVSAMMLLKNGDRLLRIAPVTSIRLESVKNHLPRIAECSWLARVTELDLSHDLAGTKDLLSLFRSEHCRSLRVLRLIGCMLLPITAHMLANMPHLQSLQTLDVSNNSLGPEGAESLARSQHLVNLRELNLAGNQILAAGVTALASSPTLRLTRLSIGNNLIGNEGAAAIARSPHVTEMRHLDLQSNSVANLGVEALVQSTHLMKLEHLNLYHNHIGARAVQLLTDSALLQNLTYLNLRSNEIDKPTLLTVPQRLQTPKMRELLY